MPELPEVETTKQALLPIIGAAFTTVQRRQPRLRLPIEDTLMCLEGQVLQRIERRAKYLQLYFNHDAWLIHLGMSGSLRLCPSVEPYKKHDHVVISLRQTRFQQDVQMRYHDPRRFGFIIPLNNQTAQQWLGHLGPEPLEVGFNADYLQQQLTAKKQPIKAAIMDQTLVVGVGNIYATEALFLSGIHPSTPAGQLKHAHGVALVDHIKAVLTAAIAQGGTTLRDYVSGFGETGYFKQTLWVYGRQSLPCMRCDTTIQTVKIAGRSSSYCPACQPFLG